MSQNPSPQVSHVDVKELHALLERSKIAPLGSEDFGTLKSAVDTLIFLTQELQRKGVSIERLRKLIFGASTEKTHDVLGKNPAPKPDRTARKPKPGHGRNRALEYPGAQTVQVGHENLHRGDMCPGCARGKVYPCQEPARLVRVVGMAPLNATVFECDRMRCNACGEVFTAPPPPGVGTAKYDESAAAMVALLRYGTGLPFNRLEKLHNAMGIPLPATTQWELVNQHAESITPVFDALVTEAAQGEVVHNDDTPMKVLELQAETRAQAFQAAAEPDDVKNRSGVRTSGVIATVKDHKVALFFTGRQHAGENLADVLGERKARLSPPIQMCDALSHNTAGDFESMVAHCLAHARRQFVEVVNHFPDECAFVLNTLGKVYQHDAEARAQKLSNAERLVHHQAHSAALMAELHTWMRAQLDQHKVEPNSGLGQALRYMLKHFSKLTLFLRVAGAPLDNNICERALKKAIMHRKNSLFYKTQHGAHVGDMYMSLIHTAELNGVNPFAYLVAVMRHRAAVEHNPKTWLPWNYLAQPKQPGASPAVPTNALR